MGFIVARGFLFCLFVVFWFVVAHFVLVLLADLFVDW